MILDMITIATKKLGSISIQASIEESHTDEMQITEHPVEINAPISDHAFKRMPEVTIKCGWSNADYKALIGTLESVFTGGGLPTSEYINTVYSQLLQLQESRVPFDVVTSRRTYTNMLLQSLSVTTDVKTYGALMVMATCKQVNIVNTQVTTLPPKENMGQPKATAEMQNSGSKAAVPASPSPGGAVPQENR